MQQRINVIECRRQISPKILDYARAKVCKFESSVDVITVLDKDILRLDVTMEYTFRVHVVDRTHHLPRIYSHKLRVKVPLSTPNELVQVKLH